MKYTLENAVWIGADELYSSPVITRRFVLRGVKEAALTLTGLGYFEARINGLPVTDQYFLPVVSDYEIRDLTAFLYPLKDETQNRIYCYEFDVAPLLHDGENVLEIRLGNGFYRQTERCCEGPTFFGSILKTIYRLDAETADGTVCIQSDGSETQRDSEIRDHNLFHGEVIDYTADLADEKPVLVLPAPKTLLSPAIGTPDRIIRTVKPLLLGEKDGKKLFDAGENLTGIVRLTTSAPRGTKNVLRFAEEIRQDLTLDFASTGCAHVSSSGKPQIMEDVFVTDGQARVFAPRFVWHAFRYFEVEGPFDQVEVCVIHSDTPVTSSFRSDLEGLQFLYDGFVRTQLGNMHGSHPSDCPHRERLGYTGDGQVCAPAAMMTLDCREFYRKWIQDILDCQDRRTGHVQHTAPLMGGGGGPGVWGAAIITVPYAYYRQYGDRDMLKTCFEPMMKWIGYLTTRMEDGLIVREEEGGWCLGDWCTLEKIRISTSYVNTCCFVRMLTAMEDIAQLLGRTETLAHLHSLKADAQEAIRRRFFNPGTGHYDAGDQGADAYAVWCGLEGAEKAAQVAAFYDGLGHFDTGFVGTDVLLEVLFTHGHADTAIRLLESRELGSYLYMKDRGATTIWENWNGAESHNHPMFAAGARQLFTGVLGIHQREGTAGYQDVIIQPCTLPDGKTVSGSLMTPLGRLSVEMDNASVSVEAPAGMQVAFAEDGRIHTLITA
ncbi:MAG: family 78 glycoside hydrolase catalytic domain [Clostridia bacterium]|nr:family 78 glycoside hydrolase catalytic domain [Clostridia bacterium]